MSDENEEKKLRVSNGRLGIGYWRMAGGDFMFERRQWNIIS